jgi:hypothetical protein
MNSVGAPNREAAAVSPEDRAPPARWQFNLREAFLATTAAAGAAALAGSRGLGSLVLSLGLAAAWLNVRGRLASLQTRRARPQLFYAGWLLLGVSLFLPAMKGCNNSTLRGWQTAQAAVMLEAGAVTELIEHPGAVLEQGDHDLREGARFWTIITLINAANLSLLLTPLLLWRLQRGKGEWLGAAFALAAVSPWAVPLRDPEVLVGCYVWCAAFLVVLLSYRIRASTFYPMLALAAVYVLL